MQVLDIESIPLCHDSPMLRCRLFQDSFQQLVHDGRMVCCKYSSVKPCGGREEPGITLFRFLGGVEAEAALDEVFRFRDARNECRSAE